MAVEQGVQVEPLQEEADHGGGADLEGFQMDVIRQSGRSKNYRRCSIPVAR